MFLYEKSKFFKKIIANCLAWLVYDSGFYDRLGRLITSSLTSTWPVAREFGSLRHAIERRFYASCSAFNDSKADRFGETLIRTAFGCGWYTIPCFVLF